MSEEELKDCPVDDSGDLEDPNNLFTCKISESCCTVDLKPACCSTKDIGEELLDQLKLWGPLLLIIFLLALFIWWCRSDETCCDVEKPWLYRCGCQKPPPEDEENSESLNGSRLSIRSSKTVVTMEDEILEHDAADLELAAENLEQQLDNEAQEEEDESEDEDSEEEEEEEADDDEKKDEDDDED